MDGSQPSSPSPAGPLILGNQQLVQDENVNPNFQFGDQSNTQKFFSPSPTPMRVDVLRHGGGMNSAVDFRMQVIRLATEEILKQSGNLAYNKLVLRNFELETEIRVCNGMYGKLLGNINERQLSGTGNDGLPPPIVLPRLDRNNYQFVTIWTVDDWQKSKKKNDDASIRKKKGRPAKNADSMTRESMAYIQDENGKPVTEARARDICNEARKVFSKLEELKMAPRTWTKISSASSQYYRQVMYGYFPELQFCDGDWKAERLGIDIYPSWSRQRAEEDDAEIKKEEKQVPADGAEEISKKRKPSEHDNEEQQQQGKRARSIAKSATMPNTSDYQAEVAIANSPSTPGSIDDEATLAEEHRCHSSPLKLKNPLSATPRVSSPLSVANSGCAPASNTISSPLLPANTNAVSAPATNVDCDGSDDLVGNEIEEKRVDNSVNEAVADSTTTTKEAAPPQITTGDAHSTTSAAAAGNSADETQVNAVNAPALAALPAHNNVEATKKKPAAGDIFRFQPNNCAEWNLFGEEYSKSNPCPTKQDVRAAYNALSAEEKQSWSQRRSDKLANRKASGKKRE
ncbi:hypothetical protein BDZ97DRAFT_1754910 [Flammula alnicola]|nr:hypothetical protein BDZ97DRAFT_1754910 [Flammula alnicola]